MEMPINARGSYGALRNEDLDLEMMIEEDDFEDNYEDYIDEMLPPEALLDHYADQPFSKKPLSKRIIDTFQLGLAGKQEKGVSCSICYMDFKNGKNES